MTVETTPARMICTSIQLLRGVWVARMLVEMGATPILCGLVGGETGAIVRTLLERMPIELRLVETKTGSGGYVMDAAAARARSSPPPVGPCRRRTNSMTSPPTRAGAPILAVCDDADPYEIVPPRFEHGFREGVATR